MRNFSTCVQYTGKRTKNTREVIQAVLKDLSEQVIFKLTNKSSNKNIQRFSGKHFRYDCQYIFSKEHSKYYTHHFTNSSLSFSDWMNFKMGKILLILQFYH
jgi:hypothetical protein